MEAKLGAIGRNYTAYRAILSEEVGGGVAGNHGDETTRQKG